jgi:hypothetical protein
MDLGRAPNNELQLQPAAGAVSTPRRKRKLQVQAALATRKQHCSSGGVINTVVVITINIHVKGIGGLSHSLLQGVLRLMFQRETLIQEVGVGEDSVKGDSNPREGVCGLQHRLFSIYMIVFEKEWENTVDKLDTVACNTGLHTDRRYPPSSRSPWNPLKVISHQYTGPPSPGADVI